MELTTTPTKKTHNINRALYTLYFLYPIFYFVVGLLKQCSVLLENILIFLYI